MKPKAQEALPRSVAICGIQAQGHTHVCNEGIPLHTPEGRIVETANMTVDYSILNMEADGAIQAAILQAAIEITVHCQPIVLK